MEEIIEALEDLESTGTFWSKQTAQLDDLTVAVKSIGELKFPLSKKQVKSMLTVAKPAKFGWKDKTIFDDNVRSCWEISKNNINIDTRHWNKTLKPMLNSMKENLGLPKRSELKANFYNMLIYSEGHFFKPHRDTEKCDNMIATLIIILPSKHSGGNLIVEHYDEKKQFQSSRFSLDQINSIAFYADCYHEIKKVTSGYRVALTYNISLKNGQHKILQSNINDNIPISLLQSLVDYFNSPIQSEFDHIREQAKKCLYLFDHDYTAASFSWNNLKGRDHQRAEALKAIAEKMDYSIYLVLADVQETWNCDENTGYDSYWYDDDQSEDAIDVNELIMTETTLTHWLDSNNKKVKFDDFYLSDKYICWTKANDEYNPYETEYEGFMGNYGNTLDKWYHRAGVIMWKNDDDYVIRFDVDANKLLKELLDINDKTKLQKILRTLLPKFPRNTSCFDKNTILQLAINLKNRALAFELLSLFNIEILQASNIHYFNMLKKQYSEKFLITILSNWGDVDDNYHNFPQCKKIAQLVKKIVSLEEENNYLLQWLLAYQFTRIEEDNVTRLEDYSRMELISNQRTRHVEMREYLSACIIAENPKKFNEAIVCIIKNSELYPSLTLIEVVNSIRSKIKNTKLYDINKLVSHVTKDLEKCYKKGLRKKGDWRISISSRCQCEDCKELNKFLKSNKSKLIWPLAKDRRKHIHRIIEGLNIGLTHNTERKGSPHKLIITKTNKLHQLEKKEFDKVRIALKTLDYKETVSYA